MKKVVINVDGGSRGNPGPAAVAAVIQSAEGAVLEEHAERIGRATNNVAEYRALLLGIQRAAELGVEEVELVGDSELIVRQVKGEYKVKDAALRGLYAEVIKALAPFARWSIRHVRRDHNANADRLVNEVLDRAPEGDAVDGAPNEEVLDRAPGREPAERLGLESAGAVTEPTPSGAAATIDPGVDIGHVHLKVADIDRALDFYCGVLGFELQQRLGDEAAFVSAGDYHHHIGLNTWHSKGAGPPPARSTGLFHLAIRYPTRAALADALRRLSNAGIQLSGASDHGVSEALYLNDPDGNGIELYWDRPREDWPRPAGGEGVAMVTRPLDLQALLGELGS